MTAGTRIGPEGSTRQLVGSMRVNRAGSMAGLLSYVYNAGGRPHAVVVLRHFQRGVGGALRFAGGAVSRSIDRFAVQRAVEMLPGYAYLKAPEYHVVNCHLVDDGVQPFGEQELSVGRFATHPDHVSWFDFAVRNDCGQGAGRLLERL